ncbi:IS110 family transposase, partial [Escherichia coli]
ALRDPLSRAYYTRKMSQGKRHNQVLIALARRDFLYPAGVITCLTT